MNFEKARFNMIEQQVRPYNIFNNDVLTEMQEVPRELFVPEDYKNFAFSDIEIPLANEQTMLAPKYEAKILQSVQPKATDTALEIGTGSGFLTACLANKVHSVTSVDIYPEFLEQAAQKCQELGINNITFENKDASSLYNENTRFDIIIISAAMSKVPESYKQSLNINGRMFVVTGNAPTMHAHLITRLSENDWQDEILFETEFAYLVNGKQADAFDF